MCVLLFWHPFPGKPTAALPDLGRVPRFHLVDQEHRPVDERALLGHLTVVQVICSRCAPASPMLLSRFAEIDQNFRRSNRLRLFSLTAEPSIDSPGVLAAIRARYEATDHWSFLTGEEGELTHLAAGLFRLDEPPSGKALARAASGAQLAMVDDEGRVRRIYAGLEDDVVASILSDAGTLLRSSEKQSE